MANLASHVEEYVGRYVMVASIFLVPLAGLLGTLGAQLGGVHTSIGRAVLGAGSAVGAAGAIGVWLKNLGVWQASTQPFMAEVGAPLQPVDEAGVRPDAPIE